MSAQRPYVTLISEMTVDGKLTLKRGLSSKIIMGLMDEESQRFLHKKRTEFDAIMVGSNTIKIDNSILTNRLVDGKSPIRVIPCSDASIPVESSSQVGPTREGSMLLKKKAQRSWSAARTTSTWSS
jgi:2,5-diamino-6-(ribosylamino)-4(3H)-pyrimidinone 5'-phosphate reductase